MFKIGIIQNIHSDGLKLFDSFPNFEFEIVDDLSVNNLKKKLPLYDGITLRTSKLNSDLLSEAKKLKVISRHGVGYDNVDLNYIKKNNITLLITATANAVAVAEHVLSMFLCLSKSIITYDNLSVPVKSSSSIKTNGFAPASNKHLTMVKYLLFASSGSIDR